MRPVQCTLGEQHQVSGSEARSNVVFNSTVSSIVRSRILRNKISSSGTVISSPRSLTSSPPTNGNTSNGQHSTALTNLTTGMGNNNNNQSNFSGYGGKDNNGGHGPNNPLHPAMAAAAIYTSHPTASSLYCQYTQNIANSPTTLLSNQLTPFSGKLLKTSQPRRIGLTYLLQV